MCPILTDLTGITFPLGEKGFPEVWNWPRHHLMNAGYAQAEADAVVSQAWEVAKKDPAFWSCLSPMSGAREALKLLKRMSYENDVYFITSRPGNTAKQQTEDWIEALGYSGPTVILSFHKGLVCAGINIDHFIDDKPDNHIDVQKYRGTKCSYYLIDAPYNTNDEQTRSYVKVVGNAVEAVKLIG